MTTTTLRRRQFKTPGLTMAMWANSERPGGGTGNQTLRLLDLGHAFGCHLFTHTDITEADERRLRWWDVEDGYDARGSSEWCA